MKRHTVLLFSLVLVFCLSVAPSVMAASAEDEVLQVASNFAKAFSTSDFELMSSLHWHSPKLIKFTPSKSGAFLLQGWDAVAEDWKQGTFNAAYPKGTFGMSNHNPQVTMLGDNIAVITLYQITISNPPASKEQTVEQHRQTLVVQKIDGKWLIVHEHVSMLPTQ